MSLTRQIHEHLCMNGLMKDRARVTNATCRPEIRTRNLIYHIAPFASNDTWRRNVKQLVRRIDQFNGRRIVAVVVGECFVPLAEVRDAFGDMDVEFVALKNDKRLRERASAEILLGAVESTDSIAATFYAHAKGVSTSGDTLGVTYWRNAMYHELLDDPVKIGELLKRYQCVGTHRLANGKFPDGFLGGWHYSGTFWWFRNDAFFSQPWREIIPDSGWGMEALPGLMFPFDDSACVFMEQCPNPYDPKMYAEPIPDDDALPAKSNALKVELGGGETPIGSGYVNVDRLPCACVQCDFERDRLPFDDGAVSDLYTSHTLEHVANLRHIMREIVRVCRLAARVEIRVPHWNHNMAICYDHKHAITYEQAEHWCQSAVPFWFSGLGKRLSMLETHRIPSRNFARMKAKHPGWSDEEVMEHVPDTCHEYRFIFTVVPYAAE